MNKPYEVGLIIGRFQPLHKGHIRMISTAFELCNKVVIMIGSADKHDTPSNPWYYAERECFIQAAFYDELLGGRLQIIPLPDVGIGNGKEWGQYVLNMLRPYCYEMPDLYITGSEPIRKSWFEGLDVQFDTLTLNRATYQFSGTEAREAILKDDKEAFRSICGQYSLPYDKLRERILKVNGKGVV